MAKCPKCQEKKGKRRCPALSADICQRCCGEHRLKTIPCPRDCEYLDRESYQVERRQEKSRSGGKKFIEKLRKLFSGEDSFNFSIMLHADIFAFCQVHGPLDDNDLRMVFEGLKGLLSPIYVPSDGEGLLASYLLNRIENCKRYRISPGLGKRDQFQVLEKLIGSFRPAPSGESASQSTSYFDEIAQFFEHIDFTQDLGFTDEDFALLRGDGRADHRSAGGIILPG